MALEDVFTAVHDGNRDKAAEETKKLLDSGVPAEEILNQACIPAMAQVGEEFEAGEKFVPEMLIAARAMSAAMELLKPELVKADVPTLGTFVCGTVQGDLHDIGKNLVKMMMEGAGFQVVDLGVDVSAEKFVDAAVAENANLIGLSALLTTTMPGMKDVVDLVKERGLGGKVKVMIGGAPITQDYANEIGADGFAPDASSAVRTAKALIA
jgi:5-methyltetrahydrofolate--homocysteine methyltransferase